MIFFSVDNTVLNVESLLLDCP